MSDVTLILQQIEGGDPSAAEKLLPLVYDELRKLATARMAAESPCQTLQATALVHEAYLRLVDVDQPGAWGGRGHFFAAAAEAIRRILIENARRKRSAKAGGHLKRVNLDQAEIVAEPQSDELLSLDDALTKLAADDPVAANLARLRLFAGLTVDDAADCLGLSRTSGFRVWTYARAYLQAELQSDDS
ncbi:MAG: ECF-type sigma factor [Planctomycetaceae bacterium]